MVDVEKPIFKKEKIDSPVDFARLENECVYFVYFYQMETGSKIVLSEKIGDDDVIKVCNEAMNAIKDFKRDFGK